MPPPSDTESTPGPRPRAGGSGAPARPSSRNPPTAPAPPGGGSGPGPGPGGGGSGPGIGGRLARFFTGEAVSRTLNFLAFIWLARALGVDDYGTFELALAILGYFLLVVDGGLEVWATREAARLEKGSARELQELARRVLGVRLGVAVVLLAAMVGGLQLVPDASLRRILMLLGLSLPVAAANLRWAFLGRERMGRVATGQVVGHLVFAIGAVTLVREPGAALVAAAARVAGDTAATLFFGAAFLRSFGLPAAGRRTAPAASMLGPALTLAFTRGLGLLTFNLDSLLLGILRGTAAVGLYGAAYKPVTVALAVPAVLFTGLFPALSRAHRAGPDQFRRLTGAAFHLAVLAALPVGVGAMFLADDIIGLLFTPGYAPAAGALRILGWSAALVLLRGTFRWGLQAAGRERLDAACALLATAVNVGLNLALIPTRGILGAAQATVASDVVWLVAVIAAFPSLRPAGLLQAAWRPVAAAGVMAAVLLAVPAWPWPVRGVAAVAAYLGGALLLGERPSALRLPDPGDDATGPTRRET